MITVVAPHARPEFSSNLLASFLRQEGSGHELLVVENGEAVGTFPSIAGIHVIRSAQHQADAMNAGLAWLRARGGGSWARFDDDDYYGPGYLAQSKQLLRTTGAAVVGKPWSFVMLDEGLYRFSANRNDCWAEGFDLTGGSLAAASADVPDFPRVADDDLRWCRSVRDAGGKLWAGPPHRYCYDRRTRARRVIPGGSVVTRFAFGEAEFFGALPAESVDREDLVPVRLVPPPSDSEVCAAI